MNLLFLGSGGSMGVPVIGCKCVVCLSSSSYNKRFRPSILITFNEKKYLIDIGPDYRTQALTYQIDSLDGILLTHTHYDHVGGFDEVRAYTACEKRPLPCLLSRNALEDLKIRYPYFFFSNQNQQPGHEKLIFHILEQDQGTVQFEGLPISYVSYEQVGMKVNGFVFGPVAYIVDLLEYSDGLFKGLEGVDVLIMSGRSWHRSRGHLSLKEAIDFSKRCGAKRTYFTHICHEIEHAETSQRLPEAFFLAYDGLQLMV